MSAKPPYINYGDEIFNYARDAFAVSPDQLVIVEGPGAVTMAASEHSYATVAQMRQGEKPGILLSASLLTELVDLAGRRALAIVRRSADAQFEPGKLQFPAGRCSPGEPACDTAIRELFEELRVEDQGEVLGRHSGRLSVAGGPTTVHFVPAQDLYATRKFHCQAVDYSSEDHTLEFYFHGVITVSDLRLVVIGSNESYHQIELLSPAQVLLCTETLTRPAQRGLALLRSLVAQHAARVD